MKLKNLLHGIPLVLLLTSGGCGLDEGMQSSKPAGPKTTTDIGEFQVREGEETVSSDIVYTNPVTGPLEALPGAKQQISELAIQHAVDLFQATNGRYPKDHDEFMTQVIQANNMRLPVLPKGQRYEYDVANHKLMVVQDVQQPAK
ncbi:MAG: hypothetical protein R3C19_17715 [Planctomycetaceae bacterium]